MAIKAKLKFRGDMPWELEHDLCYKYGFNVYSRKHPEWVILEKRIQSFVPEVLVNGELPEEVQTVLTKRCNTIVNQFIDPDNHEKVIRMRITHMAGTLPAHQRKFVLDWLERNFGKE